MFIDARQNNPVRQAHPKPCMTLAIRYFWRDSGLSQTAFCKSRKLSLSQFTDWRAKILAKPEVECHSSKGSLRMRSMKEYSEEFKTSIIARMLPPNNVGVPQLAQETGIPGNTL